MGKFEDYGILAEKSYVEEQLPISSIAKKLNITEKSLHDWKKKGGWDEKRRQFLSSQYNCYGSLYELLNKIVQKSLLDCDQTGDMPDAATLYFIKAMADKLPKIKKLENEIVQEKQVLEQKPINTDVLSSIDKFLKGQA